MNKLYYIIGASGAGKDSLINYCRDQISGDLLIVFAHRYITRPVNTGAENHVSLTENEFKVRLKHGLFALHWQSYGLYYGIGIEINDWLEQGLNVVVNGSREYLPTAIERYPNMQPILIGADNELIKERLHGRGRENTANIAERIARNEQFDLSEASLIRITNNTELMVAANKLLDLLVAGTKTPLFSPGI